MKDKRTKIILACLVAGVLFVAIGYQQEESTYDCALCRNRKKQKITRLWFLPLISTETVQHEHSVRSGHVHQWRFYGGHVLYGYNGWMGGIASN